MTRIKQGAPVPPPAGWRGAGHPVRGRRARFPPACAWADPGRLRRPHRRAARGGGQDGRAGGAV